MSLRWYSQTLQERKGLLKDSVGKEKRIVIVVYLAKINVDNTTTEHIQDKKKTCARVCPYRPHTIIITNIIKLIYHISPLLNNTNN